MTGRFMVMTVHGVPPAILLFVHQNVLQDRTTKARVHIENIFMWKKNSQTKLKKEGEKN
jgi:hypothetical protein